MRRLVAVRRAIAIARVVDGGQTADRTIGILTNARAIPTHQRK